MRSAISALVWGLAAGFIALAAGLGSITLGTDASLMQLRWVAVASILAAMVTTIKAGLDSESERRRRRHDEQTNKSLVTVDDRLGSVDNMLSRLELQRIELARVVVGEILARTAGVAAAVLKDPILYEAKLGEALEALHYAIVRPRSTGDDRVRVAFICATVPEDGSDPRILTVLHCVPESRQLKLRPSEELYEQFLAIQSRRYPFALGYLHHRSIEMMGRNDPPPLAPPEADVVSFLRVGLPELGVLWIDSWDSEPLDVADKANVVSYTEILSLIKPQKRKVAVNGQSTSSAVNALEGKGATS